MWKSNHLAPFLSQSCSHSFDSAPLSKVSFPWIQVYFWILNFILLVYRSVFIFRCYFKWSSFKFVLQIVHCWCVEANGFPVLILYSATLMNLIIDSSNFLLDSPGFSIHRIMLSMNKDRFTSHSTVWIPFMFCLWYYFLFYMIFCKQRLQWRTKNGTCQELKKNVLLKSLI